MLGFWKGFYSISQQHVYSFLKLSVEDFLTFLEEAAAIGEQEVKARKIHLNPPERAGKQPEQVQITKGC